MTCIYCGEDATGECPSCAAPICPNHSYETPLYSVCSDPLACELRRLEAAGWTREELAHDKQ